MVRHLSVFTLLYAGAYVLRGVFQFMTSYLAHVTAWRFVSDLRVALYHHLQKLSLRFYHDKQTGEVMSRVVNDTDHIEPLVAHNIPDLIVNSLMIVGIAGILFYLFPSLALLTLLPVPLLVITVLAFSGRTRRAFQGRPSQAGRFQRHLAGQHLGHQGDPDLHPGAARRAKGPAPLRTLHRQSSPGA